MHTHKKLIIISAILLLSPVAACALGTEPAPTSTTMPAPPTNMPAAASALPAVTPVPTPAPPTLTPLPPTPAPTLTLTGPPPASTDTPTAMSSPTQPPQPATAPAPTAAAGAPRVIFFTATPTTTLTLGAKIILAWEAIGEKAEICPIVGRPVEGKCVAVPLKGTMVITTGEDTLDYNGMGLRVTVGQDSVWGTSNLHLQCQGWRDWFFSNHPLRCPEAAASRSRGAAEYFEHGFMIWTEMGDTSYIFFDSGDEGCRQLVQIAQGPLSLKPGASVNNRITEMPPAGYYQPVSGFGLLWRGEVENQEDIRQRLGWALAPEFGFDTAYQCEISGMAHTWTCYLQAPEGKVLRLHPDSTAQVRFCWDDKW